jgi:deoxyguanosine kinase
MRWCPFIGFEGPIGVGKTTLTRLLSAHMNATPLYENIHNPFLADFYEDKVRWGDGHAIGFFDVTAQAA